MKWYVRVPDALHRIGVEKAGGEAALQKLVVRWLSDYVNGTSMQAMGGKARAANMTPEERRASARKAAYARHGLPVPED